MSDSHNVTRILNEISRGRRESADALLRVVYEELRMLARQRMSQERADHTWQPTDLVHEAYMRLLGVSDESGDDHAKWHSRAHFYGAAAEAMRRVLVEHARRRGRVKRGGDRQRIDLTAIQPQGREIDDSVLAMHEALTRFEQIDPQKAALVKLRYFAGLQEDEAASVLGVSRATAARHWAFARAWLYDAIKADNCDDAADRREADETSPT